MPFIGNFLTAIPENVDALVNYGLLAQRLGHPAEPSIPGNAP